MSKTTEQILGTLYENVNHFDSRINYHVRIFIGGCNYEVLINDYPVDRYFGPGNGAASGSAPINIAILKPGVQTWKIRVYPIRDRKEINGEVTMVPQATIQAGAQVELSVEGIRFKENGDIEERFGEVVNFKAPLKKDAETGRNIFVDAGKPFVEYSGTFQAEVPYELIGWENSQDLRKSDTQQLKEELLQVYHKFHEWLQDRNLEQIANAKFNAEKEVAQALFYDKKTNDNFLSAFIERWGQPGLKMQPIENYKLTFYGDGRIVTLTDVIDGGSPLWGNYQLENGNYKHNTYLLYFHRPKGKQTLEVIR